MLAVRIRRAGRRRAQPAPGRWRFVDFNVTSAMNCRLVSFQPSTSNCCWRPVQFPGPAGTPPLFISSNSLISGSLVRTLIHPSSCLLICFATRPHVESSASKPLSFSHAKNTSFECHQHDHRGRTRKYAQLVSCHGTPFRRDARRRFEHSRYRWRSRT
jgi:hypothetical protein